MSQSAELCSARALTQLLCSHTQLADCVSEAPAQQPATATTACAQAGVSAAPACPMPQVLLNPAGAWLSSSMLHIHWLTYAPCT